MTTVNRNILYFKADIFSSIRSCSKEKFQNQYFMLFNNLVGDICYLEIPGIANIQELIFSIEYIPNVYQNWIYMQPLIVISKTAYLIPKKTPLIRLANVISPNNTKLHSLLY